MRLIYSGLSGVGKDYLLSKVDEDLNNNSVRVLSMGDMICSQLVHMGIDVGRDELSNLDRELIASVTKIALHHLKDSSDKLLLNTHLVTEGSYGRRNSIGLEGAFYPTSMLCIVARPEDIIARRSSDGTRRRPKDTAANIGAIQREQLQYAIELSNQLAVPLSVIDNSNDKEEGAVMQLRATIRQAIK